MRIIMIVLLLLNIAIAFVFRYITNDVDESIWHLLIAIFVWIAIIGIDIRNDLRENGGER